MSNGISFLPDIMSDRFWKIICRPDTKGGVDIVDLLSTSHSTRIKMKRWPWMLLPLYWIHANQMQRPSLQTTEFSSSTLNSHTTLTKPWYSLQLSDNTATQMDYKSDLSTRCDMFLVSRFHGSLMSRMPKQSLVGASNAWKELLVPAHTRLSKERWTINWSSNTENATILFARSTNIKSNISVKTVKSEKCIFFGYIVWSFCCKSSCST